MASLACGKIPSHILQEATVHKEQTKFPLNKQKLKAADRRMFFIKF